jgi:hypothetical protein
MASFLVTELISSERVGVNAEKALITLSFLKIWCVPLSYIRPVILPQTWLQKQRENGEKPRNNSIQCLETKLSHILNLVPLQVKRRARYIFSSRTSDVNPNTSQYSWAEIDFVSRNSFRATDTSLLLLVAYLCNSTLRSFKSDCYFLQPRLYGAQVKSAYCRSSLIVS